MRTGALAFALVSALVPAMLPHAARADGGDAPVGEPPDGSATYQPKVESGTHPIVITTPGEHSNRAIALAASLAGAGAVLGGIGAYYNLDSRTAANNVSPAGPTNQPWTPADQAQYDRAHDSAVKAGVFYGVGGALVIGAIVAWIVTVPPEQRTTIYPHTSAAPAAPLTPLTPIVAPTTGGAIFGGAWAF